MSEAAIGLGRDLAVEVLHMDTPTDLSIMTVFVFLGYGLQYTALGGLFELTNPKGFNSKTLPKKEIDRRYLQVKQEYQTGVYALLWTVIFTMVWMYFIAPRTYFYGFFLRRTITTYGGF